MTVVRSANNDVMFDGMVRFEFHFKTSKLVYKMTVPKDVHEFIENLKLHSKDFMYNPNDELIVLYPIPEGRMVEMKLNDDIEFLMKTKLCFDLETNELYCNAELLIIVEKTKIDPVNQITVLCQKFDQLSSQTADLALSLNKKLEESAYSIKKTAESILSESYPHKYLKKTSNTCFMKPRLNSIMCIQNDLINQLQKLDVMEPDFNSQQENTKEKLSTILPSISMVNSCKEVNDKQNSLESEHITVIENQSNESENKKYCRKDMNNLIKILKEQGFTDTLRNIIILIRFDYDYETAFNYLKSNPIP